MAKQQEEDNKPILYITPSVQEHLQAIQKYISDGQMYQCGGSIYKADKQDDELPFDMTEIKNVYDKDEINKLFVAATNDLENTTVAQLVNIQMQGDILTQLQRTMLEQGTSKVRRISSARTDCNKQGLSTGIFEGLISYMIE